MPTYETRKIWEELENNEDFLFGGTKVIYAGAKNTRKMHYLAKKAYLSWLGQRNRCYNKKSKEYKYYGGKGVLCLWSSEECINFYLTEFFKRPYWNKPCISRLEDKGNYEKCNVRLLEAKENCSEIKISKKRIKASKINALKANKSIWIPIMLININNPKDNYVFTCAREADRKLNLRPYKVNDSIKRGEIIKHNGKSYLAYKIKGGNYSDIRL